MSNSQRLYEVRIYDGNGNLKEIVYPKIDYENLTSYGNIKGRKTFNKIPIEKEIYDESTREDEEEV